MQSVIHLQSKTMIRRCLFTRQNSKHDVFFTSKDDIRTFIDNKKTSFKQSVLHLNSKNDDVFLSSFLRASAMLKHVIAIGLTSVRPSVCLSVCPSVRLSVRPSHAGTLLKRLNILSCFLHHTITHSF